MGITEQLGMVCVALWLLGEGLDWWGSRLEAKRRGLELHRDILQRQRRKWGHQ